jgi:Fic family protein
MILRLLQDQRATGMKGGIYHQNQIDLAYNSNRIEGSKLSHDQTRYIFETGSIDGLALVNDVVEAANHFRAFDCMLDNLNIDLNAEKLKQYHLILKTGTKDADQDWFAVGDWKRLGNMVGGTETTPPEKVGGAIDELLALYPQGKPMEFADIVDFHYRFESIHPFQDGNGRVGRLAMFEQCLRNKILPFIVLDEEKGFYYRGLSNYDKDKNWLLDTCRHFQDGYHSKYKSLFTLAGTEDL